MCESGNQDRGWHLYVADMIESCEAVLAVTDGLDVDEFVNDRLTYKATLWDLRIIGEAAIHVPPEIREATPNVEWPEIVGMRNRLTHGYLKIRDQIVWDTIQSDVPKLLSDLRELIERFDKDSL